MKHLARLLLLAICSFVVCALPAFAQSPKDDQRPPVPAVLMRASTAAIDCDACPRTLAQAGSTALKEFLTWNRFRIVEDRKTADIIVLLSGNPYLGDYLTRDGPDNRPVFIDGVVLTVIDPHNGAALWRDYRRWGSWRIVDGTKDLIHELQTDMESQVKRWTVGDILRCNEAMAYEAFAFETPEQALARTRTGVDRISNTPDGLMVTSPDAPDFCRSAELVVGPDNQIVGFEVQTSLAETLDVGDVLEQADQFEFTSGKDSKSQAVRFEALSKDKRILIEYLQEGRQSILSSVRYFYDRMQTSNQDAATPAK